MIRRKKQLLKSVTTFEESVFGFTEPTIMIYDEKNTSKRLTYECKTGRTKEFLDKKKVLHYKSDSSLSMYKAVYS